MKLIIKAILIGVVLWAGMRALMPMIIGLAYETPLDVAQIAWRTLGMLFALGVLLFVLVGAADWSVQRWLFIRDKRMSKDEQKREFKESEGDPEIKGKRKEFAKELVFGDPRERVAKAKVMVVNPTHYAVALAYEPDDFGLPQVVAKGVDDAHWNCAPSRITRAFRSLPIRHWRVRCIRLNWAMQSPSHCSKRLRWCCAGSMNSVATTATAMEPCHARRPRASDKVFRL